VVTYEAAYAAAHRAEKKAYMAAYHLRRYKKHAASIRRRAALYRATHKAAIASKQAVYNATRLRTDARFRLALLLRTRLRAALRGGYKNGSAVRDLGCSIAKLRQHLERQFKPGMTWGNWSRTGWHIDHIRPLASFDLGDPSQLKAAVHYTNLQPLWAIENLKKATRVGAPEWS
jgi:hypothetical protein